MKQKNILFLSYWSLREPLTAAAIFPYLRLLADRDDIGRILLVTMETTDRFLPEVDLDIPKVTHLPILPRFKWWYMLSKVDLYVRSVLRIARSIRRHSIDLVFAKASLAGTIAHFVHVLTRVPYIVESFEPHSTYMLECGVWKRNGVRYAFARYMERVQLRWARNIMTVTDNHRVDLLAEGYDPERIKMIPSITDLEMFSFRPHDRERIRSLLSIPPGSSVGIYVGKFGGLYYDTEAYVIFARAFHHFTDLHVVVLSPTDPEKIMAEAAQAGIPMARFHVLTAPHVEVPAYLSSADFAFSTIKPSYIKRYQCPIKNGEYWANGLPILMTDGVADDHRLMRHGIGGSVYSPDMHDLDAALETIKRITERPDHRAEMVELAARYKSVAIAKAVYDEILGRSPGPVN